MTRSSGRMENQRAPASGGEAPAAVTRPDDDGCLYCMDFTKDCYTVMPESTALVILRSAARNPYTNAAGTSMAQYSVIYNIAKKTMEVRPFRNDSKSFRFDGPGRQIPGENGRIAG